MSVFAGVGIVSLPVQLMLGFLNRPKIRSSKYMKYKKELLKESVKALYKNGLQLQERQLLNDN